MKYEFYKLFVKRRAWLLILVFMALRLVTVYMQPHYVLDYKTELFHDAYMEHLNVVEGKLNEEKEDYIAEQNRRINELLKEDTSIEEYASGKLTEEEFNERYRQRNTGYEQQEAFSVINAQYQSALQNPDRVYFIYANGWTGLMGNENLDFVLLLLLLILIVPMICDEFSTDMYSVLRTTPNGGARLFLSKFAVGMITALLSAILLFTEQALFFAVRYGLPDGSFPLQSLPPFVNSPYQISIYGAAALTLANYCFGAMYMTAFLMCLSTLLRRSLSVIFVGTVGILLPFVLFSQSVMKYLFPTPLGFLLSSGFLKGVFPVNPSSTEFLTITPRQYLTTVCISAGIILVFLWIGVIAFSGKTIRLRKTKALACLLCIPFIFMTGCGQSSEPDFSAVEDDFSGFVYDKWSYQPVTEEFSVVRDENNAACLSAKNEEELIPLIHDCFADTGDSNPVSMPMIDGETVYYLHQYSSIHYEIIALNPKDFSERSVYEVKFSDNGDRMDMLFGLGNYIPTKLQQEETVDSFFVHANQLILSTSNGIYWVDLNTNRRISIYDKQADNLAFTCGAVYYTDEILDVYRYDLKTKSNSKLPVGKTQRFYAAENGLYFRDLRDGEFYFINADGSQKELLPNFSEEQFLEENEK